MSRLAHQLRRVAEVNPVTPEFEHVPDDAEITFLPLEAVWPDGHADICRRALKADVANGYTRFRRGDVLVPKVTPTFEAGRTMVAEIDTAVGAASTEVHVVRARSDVDPRFLAYTLRSTPFLREGETTLQGVGNLRRVPSDFMKRFPVCAFDSVDQRAVADFLDRETAQVDATIGAQLRLLIRLAERRTAILDGLVQRVVETHSTTRLKFVAQVTVGIVVTPSLWYADEGVPALRGVNVRPEQIDLTDLVRLSEEGDYLHMKSRLRTGDVVVVRTGQAGSAAVITPELDGVNAIDLLIIRPGQELDGGYLAAVINSDFVRGQITSASVGAIQSHFNVEALANLHVPVMPPQEQLAFLREWREPRERVDGIIARTRNLIELMKERRAALITAAVTGRLDPRTGVERLDDIVERVAS